MGKTPEHFPIREWVTQYRSYHSDHLSCLLAFQGLTIFFSTESIYPSWFWGRSYQFRVLCQFPSWVDTLHDQGFKFWSCLFPFNVKFDSSLFCSYVILFNETQRNGGLLKVSSSYKEGCFHLMHFWNSNKFSKINISSSNSQKLSNGRKNY